MSASVEEKQELVEEILNKEAELDRQAAAQDSLSRVLQAREKRTDQLAEDLARKEQRIAELDGLLQERENALQQLRQGLLDALKGYSAAELSVREENGRVYVSMSQQLLFPSGSDSVEPKGKEALTRLAAVLQAQKEVDILVEGHTDTDGSAAMNWDLSVDRATSVVKILTGAGVDARQVTAAGRSFFLPVADNETEVGKARNRRVEIILAPQLDKILELIGQE